MNCLNRLTSGLFPFELIIVPQDILLNKLFTGFHIL